jgi:hypothetical protein
MTHLTTIVGSFQAKVVAARLGAEGIPAQLRGGIDGIYPIFNEVRVYVPSDQAEAAREILLADSVDAVFDDAGYDEPASHDLHVATRLPRSTVTRDRTPSTRLVAITMVVIVMLVVVGYLAVMGAD